MNIFGGYNLNDSQEFSLSQSTGFLSMDEENPEYLAILQEILGCSSIESESPSNSSIPSPEFISWEGDASNDVTNSFSSTEENSPNTSEFEIINLEIDIEWPETIETNPWSSYVHPQSFTLNDLGSSTKREREQEEGLEFSQPNKRVKQEEFPTWNFPSYTFSKVNTIQSNYNQLRCGIEQTLTSLKEEMTALQEEYQQICYDFLTQAQFPPKPEGITEDLMPYQWFGYKWMELLSKHGIGGCLADDMGLGKTMQSIALIQSVVNEKKNRGEQARILVSCPAKLMENWKKEFQAKSAELSSTLHVIEGKENVPAEASICLISHEKLRLDSQQADSPLCAQNWDLTICDEFHTLLSPTSQKVILNLRQRSHGLIGLTGTPMPNGLIELYKLNYLLNPNLYPKEKAFTTQCLQPAKEELKTLLKVKQQEGKVPDNYQAQNLEEHLVQLIDLLAKPFMLRRLKSQTEFSEQMEVMQRTHANMSSLPPLQPEKGVPYKFSDLQTELVEAIMQDKNMEEEEKLNEQGVLSLFQMTTTKKKKDDEEVFDMTDFLCLRQIADHPSILSETLITRIEAIDKKLADRIKQLPDDAEIGKIKAISDLVQQILKDNPQDKILIFTNFEGMGTRVCEALKKSNLNKTMKKTEFIYGKTKKDQRGKKIAHFQSEKGSSVMVLGRQVGSVGLNITKANHVIIADPWWNYNNDDQCIGRAYRIGQKKPVHVYRLHQPGFVVDEKMGRVCVEKRTWSDLILSQDSSQVPQLVGQLVHS